MLMFLIIYTIIGIIVTKFDIKNNLDYYAVGSIGYIIYIIISHKYKKEKI